jgi:hypothetical protein
MWAALHDAMTFPFAINGISNLASTALHAWNRMTDSQSASAVSGPTADFQALLQKASSTQANNGDGFPQGVAALPEVKATLASVGAGTPVQVTVSPDGSVSQILPSGEQKAISLSADSQAYVQQWNMANPGASLSIPLVC